MLVLQHGQHADRYAQVAAAKVALSTAVFSSKAITEKAESVHTLLESPSVNLEQLLREFEELLVLVRQNQDTANKNMQTVAATLDTLLTTVVNVTSEATEYKQRVQNLESEVEVMKDQLAEQRRLILMGQLAYVVDTGAARFVYGPDYDFNISFKDMVDDVRFGTPDEQQRLQQLVQFMDSKGLKIREVIRASSIVRQLRFEVAHGSEEERASVTRDQLQQWAQALVPCKSLARFEQLMEVASWFSKPQQPLVLAPPDEVDVRVAGKP